MASSEERKGKSIPWGIVGPVLGLVAVIAGVAIWLSLPHKGDSGKAAGSTDSGTSSSGTSDSGTADSGTADSSGDPAAGLDDNARAFWEALRNPQFKPNFPLKDKTCPLHADELLQVPVKVLQGEFLRVYSDNSFGGVATDMMKIGLGPPSSGELVGPPSIAIQDFDSLLATCKKTGATFSMQDLQHIESNMPYAGAGDKLLGWDLKKVCPVLAGRGQDTWTSEERRLVRLLTQSQCGVEDSELGFTALQGAYASNYAVYVGREYHIEADAFYALTAAYMERALKNKSVKGDIANATVQMTVGEIYRLMGDKENALRYFKLAKDSGKLDKAGSQVLDQVTALAQKGDFNLARAEVQAVPDPPIGWYLDKMLPAMNVQISLMRSSWGPQALGADWGNPDAILKRIIAGLPASAPVVTPPAPPAAEDAAATGSDSASSSSTAAPGAAPPEGGAGH